MHWHLNYKFSESSSVEENGLKERYIGGLLVDILFVKANETNSIK